MLDILACPIDKHYPLELFEINIKKYNYNNNNHNNNNENNNINFNELKRLSLCPRYKIIIIMIIITVILSYLKVFCFV